MNCFYCAREVKKLKGDKLVMKIQKRFSMLLSILLVATLLMGFSNPQASTSSDFNPIESTAATDISIDEMKSLIDQFTGEGEISNAAISRSLNTHLTGLEHYIDKGSWQKAAGHMNGFKQLISQFNQIGVVSDYAYETLNAFADTLAAEWNIVFDSNEVMKTIKDLSVDIGPRAPGSEAEKEAANYLKNRFEAYGYDVEIQEFDIRNTLTTRLLINNSKKSLALGAATGSIETDANGVTGKLYDAGLGLPEDFTEEASGKIALVERGNNSYWEKVENATEAGAIGVVIYDNVASLNPVRPGLGNNRSEIPVVGLQKADGEALLEQMDKAEVNANLYVRTETNQKSQNVIAVKKPEGIVNPEIVYVTAHYDSVAHSPGANDDGSGTSAIVEIARTMKDLPTDKELRFIAFGAEEIGLVGSNYYVANLPQEEINRSLANFQLEMMGSAYEPGSYFAFNTVNGQTNQAWDYTNAAFDKFGYDKDKLILVRRGSSDHVPFHNAGIMATCFNMGTASGGLEPEYHTPHDTYENISQDRIQFAGSIIHSTIWDYLKDLEQEQEIEEAS